MSTTVAVTSLVSLATGYFIGQYYAQKVSLEKQRILVTNLSYTYKQNTSVNSAVAKEEEEEEESESEDELDVLPEGSIDVKKYNNFKLVKQKNKTKRRSE